MQIQLLTLEDAKNAFREVLREYALNQAVPEHTPDEYLYGLQSLADFIGTGITTAWRQVKDGKIPKYKAGKKLFFKKAEVLLALSHWDSRKS